MLAPAPSMRTVDVEIMAQRLIRRIAYKFVVDLSRLSMSQFRQSTRFESTRNPSENFVQ